MKVKQLESNSTDHCCSNVPIYEITYNPGTKWRVCNDCHEREEFRTGIKEKMRIKD